MIDEKSKELIQLHIDERLDEKRLNEAKLLLKTNAEAKAYYKDLLAAQKRVKKLEHKAAFNQFAERWPKRVRSEHEKQVLRRRVIRVASSVAAVTLVAFLGVSMLRSGLNQAETTMTYEAVEESAVMSVDEDAQNAAKDADISEEAMLESAPDAVAGEDTAASTTADAMEEQTTDSETENRETEDEVGYYLPENAIVIASEEGNAIDFFSALISLTEGQGELPEIVETRVSILLTKENYETIITFLSEKDIPTEGLDVGITLVMVFEE